MKDAVKAGAKEGGFALLIVLWTLIPLALLFVVLTGTARSDTRLAGNLVAAAEMEAAADGAISTTVFELLRQGAPAAGTVRSSLAVAGTAVAVEIVNQSGLVNPNLAQPELIAALLSRLGVGGPQALALAAAIADWRSPGQRVGPAGDRVAQYRAAGAPFESVGELGQVLGMTPQILAALEPHITVFSDRDADPALADPVVQAALRDVGMVSSLTDATGPQGVQVVRITAEARRPGGMRAVRRAVVRLGFSTRHGNFHVLLWGGPNDG